MKLIIEIMVQIYPKVAGDNDRKRVKRIKFSRANEQTCVNEYMVERKEMGKRIMIEQKKSNEN